MKGTGKVCGSCGDWVTGCSQRDKGNWQRMWFDCLYTAYFMFGTLWVPI